MKTKDLDLRNVLCFEPKGGIIQFLGHRVIILDVVAMGVLRRELVNSLGVSAARNIFTRLGYAHGWLTAESLDSEYPGLLQDPMCGPVLHTLQGIVKFKEIKIEGHYLNARFTVAWEDSYEAEQHILHVGKAHEPVCWALTGYVSGYVSRMHNREVYCIEQRCLGKGDAFCFAETRPKEEWGDAINEHLPFFQERTIDEMLKDVTTKLRHSERRLRQLKKLLDSDVYPSGIISTSKAMVQVLDLAKRAAKVDSSVVITGESGVGKEMVARLIHDESTRASRPFVAINCGAVAETLLESEFFGHVKGAFTGADRDRVGLFEAAQGGTVFLDEIGEMTPGMQTKLLRVLQEKEVRRVGENKPRSVDIKVIAATNRDLDREVETGRFRSDLYYRLCVIELVVPPLRERTEDILPLARFFLKKASERFGRYFDGFSLQAAERLSAYHWPGNVRELQNTVERAVALCSGSVIQSEDLSRLVRKEILEPNEPGGILPLHETERKSILAALEATGGDKKQAARKLGISLASLYRKLKEYGGEL